jgi:PAS domain S-box-containing protein
MAGSRGRLSGPRRILLVDRPLQLTHVCSDDGSIDFFFVFTIEDVSAGTQADKELREEERFRASLLHSPLPILLCDDREHILVVSQSWLEQSGYLRQELQRVEVDDWSPWRCSDVVLDQLRQAMIASADAPETWSGELMIRTKDGRQRLWRFVSSAMPRRYDEPRPFAKVTDQKAHEEKVHLLMRESDQRAGTCSVSVQIPPDSSSRA